MTFIWADLLWLLAAVPFLVLLYLLLLRRKRKTALRFSSLGLVKQALGRGSAWKRHLPPLLFLAGIMLMVMAIARPAATVVLPSQRGIVVLAMDISGSMRATDVEPDRMTAAQEAARVFIAAQPPHVKIGVVAFAASANIVQTPTLDREEALSAIDRFRAQRGTAVGNGILASLMSIFEDLEFDLGSPQDFGGLYGRGSSDPQDPFSGRGLGRALGENRPPAPEMPDPVEPGSYEAAVIVLLTDGQTTTGPDPIAVAQVAADLGVRVYTVGLGTPDGVILGFGGRSMRVRLDEEALKEIADITEGEYFKADTGTDLKEIYRTLSTELVMETERTEVTALFTALAAVLILAAAALSVAWFNRLF